MYGTQFKLTDNWVIRLTYQLTSNGAFFCIRPCVANGFSVIFTDRLNVRGTVNDGDGAAYGYFGIPNSLGIIFKAYNVLPSFAKIEMFADGSITPLNFTKDSNGAA